MFLAIPEDERTQFKNFERDLKRGDVVFKEGDAPDDKIYLLRQGEVHIERSGRDLGDIRALQFIGEMAVLTGKPRSATATVTSDSAVLYAFPKANIESILANKRWGRMLVERMAENLESRLHEVDQMQKQMAEAGDALHALIAELSLLHAAASTEALHAALIKGVPVILEEYLKRTDNAEIKPVPTARLDLLKKNGALSEALHAAAIARLSHKP